MESATTEAAQRHARDSAGRRSSRRWVLIGVAILLVIAVVNGSMRFFDKPMPTDVEGAVHYSGLTSTVVDGPIDYDQRPPVGGPHAATIQDCGVYRVPVSDEHAVASLATGAVWIAYRPDISSSEIKGLEDLAFGELDMILAPYPGLRAPVVMTAWGVQLDLDDPRDDRVPLFLAIFANSANAPDPSASCVGGIGAP